MYRKKGSSRINNWSAPSWNEQLTRLHLHCKILQNHNFYLKSLTAYFHLTLPHHDLLPPDPPTLWPISIWPSQSDLLPSDPPTPWLTSIWPSHTMTYFHLTLPHHDLLPSDSHIPTWPWCTYIWSPCFYEFFDEHFSDMVCEAEAHSITVWLHHPRSQLRRHPPYELWLPVLELQ